ncbi:MAG: pyruvate, water dikinase regulatory protein [Parvularculales bacterium]
MSDNKDIFHLHLISDSTGETLNTIARAACAQYDMANPVEHVHVLVRSARQLERVCSAIQEKPGMVMYTLVDNNLRRQLESQCHILSIPHVSVLDPAIEALGHYLGSESTHRPGGQHVMNSEYFKRMAALDYTIAHDDGQMTETLNEADVILVGVSRTSKTPTCMYLAHRGIRAANVPIVPGIPLDPILGEVKHPLIVGLTTNPERLIEVRRNRMSVLVENRQTNYVDKDLVNDEVQDARRLFTRWGWAVIDVTRRSVEETAAAILDLYSKRQEDYAP